MNVNNLDPRLRLAVSVIKRWRAGEGVHLQAKELKRFNATPNRCHDNVREFVEMYPELKHVRGFLLVDHRPFSDGMLVLAHSVVEAPDGSLNDITPRESDAPEAFLRHLGTPTEFELIAAVAPFSVKVSYRLLKECLGE
jgi:hypothetical protein